MVQAHRSAGMPFGNEASVVPALAHKMESIQNTCDKLFILNDSQVSLLLLRACLGVCKVNFLLRVLPYSLSHVWAPQVRACLKKAVDSIVGAPLSEVQWQQASLPCNSGGLGIRDPVMVAPFAHVASVISVVSHSLFGTSTLLLQSDSLWLAINHAAALVRSRIIGDKRISLAQWKAARQIDLSAKDEVKQWKIVIGYRKAIQYQ